MKSQATPAITKGATITMGHKLVYAILVTRSSTMLKPSMTIIELDTNIVCIIASHAIISFGTLVHWLITKPNFIKIATVVFVDSPFNEGKPNGYFRMKSKIWTDADNNCAGMLLFVFDDSFGFEHDMPMYFGLSFRDFMSGKLSSIPGELPTLNDWENHLATIFPKVRLKGNLEMRGADGGPWRSLCALPAFWGEQLKCKHVVELVDESPAPVLSSLKDTTGSKYPRYINTRLDEVYPIKKSSIRLRMLSGKESAKPEESPMEHTGTLKSCSVSAAKSQPQVSCPEDFASTGVTRDGETQASKTNEKCRESTFGSVTDLSSGGEKTTGLDTIDLDKALKGLVAHEPSLLSSLAPDSSERIGDFTMGNLCSEFNILGRMTPLDFTLKTTMRVVSSSSVNWFHRLITCGSCSGVAQFCQKMSCSSGFTSTNQVVDNLRVLHSWVYPQSSLPPSLVAALTISSTEQVQMGFLSKRQSAWEDAFRSLYYMLRKGACDIFYVCTEQFVVMFIGHGDSKESKRSCNAHISQSTRSLRSLLKEHDIQFSMPLCHSKVEQHTTEDLVELSEIEKHNLGQIRRHCSMSDVDNSPQSLLAFIGNQNVHRLFNFLLNYRFFVTSLTSADVPVLYSPVPFLNVALSSPEVRCKEVRKADNFPFPQKEFTSKDETCQGSSAGFCYSIEIKDAYLPPWIICSLCEAMGSEGMNFEASFVTESTSTGLNVGLETSCEKSNHQPTGSAGLEESSSVFGISNAIISPKLCSAFLKGLKYSNGSYTATVSSF